MKWNRVWVVALLAGAIAGASGQTATNAMLDLSSREVSLVVASTAPPAPVSPLSVTASPDGASALLSWAGL